LKKPTSSVQFWFYKPETEKTKPNPNQEKTRAKPGKNRAKTEKTEPKPKKPSQTGLSRFLPKKPNRNRSV
jgi:hypothetical protein